MVTEALQEQATKGAKLAEERRLVEEAAKLDAEVEEERVIEEERIAAQQLESELSESAAMDDETGLPVSDGQGC